MMINVFFSHPKNISCILKNLATTKPPMSNILAKLCTIVNLLSLGVSIPRTLQYAPITEDVPHRCLASAGYSWCAASNACVRPWETPCADHFNDCRDCLDKQQHGQNIACPQRCDLLTYDDPYHDPCRCEDRDPVCSVPPDFPMPVNPFCEPVTDFDECGCATSCTYYKCPLGTSCSNDLSCLNGICLGGKCVAPCSTKRDVNGNCIADGCKIWYNGCNQCLMDSNSDALMCTETTCGAPLDRARCVDDMLSLDPAPVGGICERFCIDASEPPVHRDCQPNLICVNPAPHHTRDMCGVFASRCQARGKMVGA